MNEQEQLLKNREIRCAQSDASTSVLLPCPFCGGEPKQSVYHGSPKVECSECGIYVMNPDAAKDWNTRVSREGVRIAELERVNGVLLQMAESSKLDAEIWSAKHAVLLLELERLHREKKGK